MIHRGFLGEWKCSTRYYTWIHDIIHLSEPTELYSRKSIVICKLWDLVNNNILYQSSLINCNKYATLMQDVNNRRRGEYGTIYTLVQFFYKPKTALKSKVY